MLAPVAAWLVAPDRAGRATAVVFAGNTLALVLGHGRGLRRNSLALVLGVPLGTALGHAVGWRAGMAAVGVAGVLSCGVLRLALPRLPPGNRCRRLPGQDRRHPGRAAQPGPCSPCA